MAYRNYRVLRENKLLAIHSVYNDGDGKIIGWSSNPEPAIAEDIESLRTQLTLMLEATKKEIIEPETIEKKP